MGKEVVIGKNHFKVGGTQYFRKLSGVIQLGSYGKKTKSAIAVNGLNSDGVLSSAHNLAITMEPAISINSAKTSSNAFSANVDFQYASVNGSGFLDVNWGRDVGHDLVLVKFVITSIHDLVECMNLDQACQTSLKQAKSNGRVITQAFVIVRASHYDNSWRDAKWNALLQGNVGEMTLNGTLSGGTKGGKTLTVEVGAGSVFAYGLRKPIWDKKNISKTSRIIWADADEWGIN